MAKLGIILILRLSKYYGRLQRDQVVNDRVIPAERMWKPSQEPRYKNGGLPIVAVILLRSADDS